MASRTNIVTTSPSKALTCSGVSVKYTGLLYAGLLGTSEPTHHSITGGRDVVTGLAAAGEYQRFALSCHGAMFMKTVARTGGQRVLALRVSVQGNYTAGERKALDRRARLR
jgi:hypothetical protein